MSASDFDYRATTPFENGHPHLARHHHHLPWPLLALLIALVDALLLGLLATAIGQAYYRFAFSDPSSMAVHIRLGAIISFLVVIVTAVGGGYSLSSLARQPSQPGKIIGSLSASLLILLAMLFLTKSSEDYSRSVITLVFLLGFPALWLLRIVQLRLLSRLAHSGTLEVRRLLLIGNEGRIDEITGSRTANRLGQEIAGTVPLLLQAEDPGFEAGLDRIADAARSIDPDSIVLCLPWSEQGTIEACVNRLAELPAAIHLDSDPYLRSLTAERAGAFDRRIGFQIIGRPFTGTQRAFKRALDLVVGSMALLVAAPVMLVIACLIRLESPGPVLFRQRRYGYGRAPFQIFKFRTMRHTSDNAFRQAVRNDRRITRLGHFLRKTSLDELPQLFNVLAGDMSLVGPRPHPVELDEQFSPLISHYSRRHRVLPGITGWAQVNGCRGETGTTEKMRERVLHDLHYLNNWSFWLDVKILVMTVLSAKVYRNAF